MTIRGSSASFAQVKSIMPKSKRAKMSEAAAEPEATVESIEAALERIAQLESERDEAVAARQRALADFVNFQRRAMDNEQQAARDGATRIVRSLLPVLDHFDLALDQPRDQVTLEQLAEGVGIVRDELHQALGAHFVQAIRPERGDEFDPNRHQAVMQEITSDLPPDSVVNLLQVGYGIDDRVLRPATVTVSALPADDAEAPMRIEVVDETGEADEVDQ